LLVVVVQDLVAVVLAGIKQARLLLIPIQFTQSLLVVVVLAYMD
jgi:hypothetical protein